MGSIVLISSGAFMYNYHPTQFSWLGIFLLILAAATNGIQWTSAQYIMQKSNLSAIDMMAFMQLWVMLSIIPLVFEHEGKLNSNKQPNQIL